MKNYKSLIIIHLLLLNVTLVFGNEKKTPSTIEEVTVYLDGAQIIRNASITVKEGTTKITFNALSPTIQESSIQVSGLENTSILSINYGINYLTKAANTKAVEQLLTEQQQYKDSIEIASHDISGYEEELMIMKGNRVLSNTTEVVSLEKLKTFSSYYRDQVTLLKREIYTSNKNKARYTEALQKINLQLQELQGQKKEKTGEITLKLHADKATSLNLKLTYNVFNAGWFPIYDIKAKAINTPLALSYKAHIYQNTGQSWDDVQLVLATSDPTTNNIKPEVNPKYLHFINPNAVYNQQKATKGYHYKYNPSVKTVTGIVTDESGLPLPGASIIEKGTSNGTTTDFDGRYSLQIQRGNSLAISYVGYAEETLPIHSSTMNVSLNADNTLEEVVVVGKGKRRRRNTSATQVLQGQVSGLNVTSGSGHSDAVLRGISSSYIGNEPLYVIDGIPSDKKDFLDLHQNEIKKVSVLKDAGATAIYGNRGSNGVVVVTTKARTSKGDIVEEGIASTRFEIQKKYTIPSDGDITVVTIEDYTVPADYSYFAAPLLNENVFLTATIDNWEQYNLLPAEANVYFEGSYSGKTNINPLTTKEALVISLGVDPNVVVTRKEINNFKKSQYIGSNKIISKGFEIELKNNKTKAVQLTLMDRIPISQNRDIKIDDMNYGTADYDKKKGILTWKLSLSPKSAETHSLSYSLKYPKAKRINL